MPTYLIRYCPCCGSVPRVDPAHDDYYLISCPQCGLFSKIDTLEIISALWNRRVKTSLESDYIVHST